jgi:hypothetical protein
VSGILILVKLLQPSNVQDSMLDIAGRFNSPVNPTQPSKALCPILDIVDGKLIDPVNCASFKKQLDAIPTI